MKSRKVRPPLIALWLVRQLDDFHYNYSIAGDLEEVYKEIYQEKGYLRAVFWIWFQSLGAFLKYSVYTLKWSTIMFKNYLKIAIRNTLRQKGYSFINIAGLAIGITCCLLILLWVQDELSFDRFHENSGELYRVVENQYYADGVFPVAVTPTPLAPALKEEFPEIIDAARINFGARLISRDEISFYENGIAIADPSFLKMFSFDLLRGDENTLMDDPFSIVITEKTAIKYFGDEDPVGKPLTVDNQFVFTVTGVLKNVPQNSHIQFDLIVPFSIYEEMGRSMDNWRSNWLNTYVLLDKAADLDDVNEKIMGIIKQNNEGSVTDIYLQPITRVHLHSDFTADFAGRGDVRYVYIFSMIAFLVLIIACINFMNLSTARSANRAKEVGMRKVVGALRIQLVRQFFGEAVLISVSSLLISIVTILVILPYFNDLSGKTLSLNFDSSWIILTGIIAVTIFTGIFAGSYPALLLSSFKPAHVLRGSFKAGAKSTMFRRILVVLQFSLSIFLIIGTAVVYNQLDFIRNKKLGWDKEHLLYIRIRGDILESYPVLKDRLKNLPSVLNVSAASALPTFSVSSTSGFNWEGKNPDDVLLIHTTYADYNYVETFGMEMIEGRDFSENFPSDTSNAVILNEKAVSIMGLASPIGAKLEYGDNNLNIVGVVKDYHFKPVHTEIEPMIIRCTADDLNLVAVRVGPENIQNTISSIEEVWKSEYPQYPFEYEFLDDMFSYMYRTEQKLGKLILYFSVLAVFIACLGLFGLASFTAEQKTKEIGIRKVLGASITGITLRLCREFINLVLISNIIAWPIAYFALSNWLMYFVYRIDLGWATFALSALLALTIALLTVSFQAVKAARSNPVAALKYE